MKLTTHVSIYLAKFEEENEAAHMFIRNHLVYLMDVERPIVVPRLATSHANGSTVSNTIVVFQNDIQISFQQSCRIFVPVPFLPHFGKRPSSRINMLISPPAVSISLHSQQALLSSSNHAAEHLYGTSQTPPLASTRPLKKLALGKLLV